MCFELLYKKEWKTGQNKDAITNLVYIKLLH